MKKSNWNFFDKLNINVRVKSVSIALSSLYTKIMHVPLMQYGNEEVSSAQYAQLACHIIQKRHCMTIFCCYLIRETFLYSILFIMYGYFMRMHIEMLSLCMPLFIYVYFFQFHHDIYADEVHDV